MGIQPLAKAIWVGECLVERPVKALRMYFKAGFDTNSFQNGSSALIRTFSKDGALMVK